MIGDDFQHLVRHIRAAAEAARRDLQPFIDEQERLTRQLRPVIEAHQLAAKIYEPIGRQIRQMEAEMAPLLAEIRRVFEDLP